MKRPRALARGGFISLSPPRKRGPTVLDSRLRGNDRTTYETTSILLLTAGLALTFAFVLPALAEVDDAGLFSQANEAYSSGNFETAIDLYQELVSQGKAPAEAFYNLGNAYARIQQWGRAIVNYERARRIRPRDPEVVSNLNHVKGYLKFRVKDTRNAYVQTVDHVLSFISLSETLLASAVFYSLWMAGIIILLVLRPPKIVRRFVRVIFALALISLIPASLKLIVTGRNEGIVVTKEAAVKYGPSSHDKTAFKLQEGLNVFVTEFRDEWLRIHLRDGTSGWMARDSVEMI